jgi:hypothetical protein
MAPSNEARSGAGALRLLIGFTGSPKSTHYTRWLRQTLQRLLGHLLLALVSCPRFCGISSLRLKLLED